MTQNAIEEFIVVNNPFCSNSQALLAALYCTLTYCSLLSQISYPVFLFDSDTTVGEGGVHHNMLLLQLFWFSTSLRSSLSDPLV